MVVFIEFILLDNHNVERNVKMNADDPHEVYLLKVKCGGGMLKKPYWRRCSIVRFKTGYDTIKVTRRYYGLHRVCYYAHNPDWNIYDNPRNNQIDHIDRNPTNNHISNLRQATPSQNAQNKVSKGYCYDKSTGKWVAYLRIDGKLYNEHCNTEEEAIAAREKLKAKYHTF